MRNQTRSLFISFSVMIFAACTHGPCRQVKNPELANQQSAQAATPTGLPPGSTAPGKGANAVTQPPSKSATIFVYKPDGSLQCGQGKAMSPQEMEKQLDGLKVFSRENRSDGLMHIQVCGSPTGMINVFEISATSQKDAEKRGFKKLEAQ